MMTRESGKKREQIQLMSLDDLVPQDHLARKSEAALDWNFIIGEAGFVLGNLAELAVQAFDDIGRVYDFPDFCGICKKGA